MSPLREMKNRARSRGPVNEASAVDNAAMRQPLIMGSG